MIRVRADFAKWETRIRIRRDSCSRYRDRDQRQDDGRRDRGAVLDPLVRDLDQGIHLGHLETAPSHRLWHLLLKATGRHQRRPQRRMEALTTGLKLRRSPNARGLSTVRRHNQPLHGMGINKSKVTTTRITVSLPLPSLYRISNKMCGDRVTALVDEPRIVVKIDLPFRSEPELLLRRC